MTDLNADRRVAVESNGDFANPGFSRLSFDRPHQIHRQSSADGVMVVQQRNKHHGLFWLYETYDHHLTYEFISTKINVADMTTLIHDLTHCRSM